MKILILLFLISCGNSEPTQKQVFFDSLGELEFLNTKSTQTYSIVEDRIDSFYKELFSIKESNEFNPEYQIINFPEMEFEKDFLIRIKNNSRPLYYIEKNFSKPLEAPVFKLSQNELEMLNSKRGFLAFKIPERQNLKKISILNGDELKSFYVPKTESLRNISSREISLKHIFHGKSFEKNWYRRETPNGNLLYTLNDLYSLKHEFIANSKKLNESILRKEGVPLNRVRIKEGSHFLQISAKRTLKDVLQTRKKFTITDHSHRDYCETKSHYESIIRFRDILQELNKSFSHFTDFQYEVFEDEEGIYWHVSFFLEKELELYLPRRPQSTFYFEGFQTTEEKKNLNLEAKFSIMIQSYLEPDN